MNIKKFIFEVKKQNQKLNNEDAYDNTIFNINESFVYYTDQDLLIEYYNTYDRDLSPNEQFKDAVDLLINDILE